MKKRTRGVLTLLGIAIAVLLGLLAKPIIYLASTAYHDVNSVGDLPPGFVDDASRLNQTQGAEIWPVPADGEEAERQLVGLLARARANGRRVAIGGARHSMGGHTIYPEGIVVNMLPWNRLQLDEPRNILTAQSGALWKDVIAYLDQRGRSVQIMQSNNSFSVGGSLSVNCHGWQYDRPPIASSVESFRLLKADGAIVRCSRSENQELFSLVLGGYGLFGIILDADLRVVPNERYRLEQYLVPVDQSLATLESKVRGRPDVQMVYARMNVAPTTFLGEIVLNAFVREEGEIPALSAPGNAELRRAVFRGSAESAYGKELRWSAETRVQPWLANTVFSRNQLFNEGAEVLANRTAGTTDILHEYFVPRSRVAGFVDALRRIIPRHQGNLLNITVRGVNADQDTFLRYADKEMFAFVMLFVQEKTTFGEQRMQALTRELVDAALEHEGRYYLPYRLHATTKQFYRAYPQAREFFAHKRRYDPDGLFQNQFYTTYATAGEHP